MRVIAYTYEAAVHCVDCTIQRFADEEALDVDENGVPFNATDREGNNVHPVFDIDEDSESEHCDDCFENCMEKSA